MDNIDINKLKRMIIISGIILVIVIIILLVINLNVKQEEIKEEEKILDQGNIAPVFSYEKEAVKDHSMFFSVEEAIQSYLNAIALDTQKISPEPVKGSTMRSAATIYAENHKITDEKSKKQAIYNFLEENYIKENNITEDNVMQKVEDNGSVKFGALNMQQVVGEKITQFAVYGREIKEKENKYKDVYFIVNVDNKNNTFSVKPVENNKYKELEEVPLNAEDKSIENKESNSFNFRTLQNMDIAQKYFTYYKNLLLNDISKAYNLLDEEYRNKRFGNIEEFQKYVESNKEEIKTYLAKDYSLNNYENSVEYVCADKFKNQYLFEVSSVMNFTVKLDTYTIENQDIIDEYNSAQEQKKIKMNVDKWITMINNRDYKSAYELLDDTFKNNNFQNLDKFEQYMRTTFPLHYGLTFSDFKKEGGVYIQDILLSDITANEKSITQETIIMKLTEDGFKMSFKILNH